MIYNWLLSLIFIPTSAMAFAKASILDQVLLKYHKAALVEAPVERTTEPAFGGKKKISNGKVLASGSLFRWEVDTPEKSLIVFDGSTLWTVQYLPKEFGGGEQISKSKIDKKNRGQLLITQILQPDAFYKVFKSKKTNETGDRVEYDLEVIEKELTLKKVKLVVNKSKLFIAELRYSDEIDNKIVLAFKEPQFLSKKNQKLFQYTPPKGSQVTEL